MQQVYGHATHKIYFKPGVSVKHSDIFRPAGDEDGPAFAVQGILTRTGPNPAGSMIEIIVEETEPDDASFYYSE
jgi:hypothetical protein